MGEEEAGFQIGIGHPIPVIALPVLDGIAVLDTGIADQNIQTPVGLDDPLDGQFGGMGIGDVEGFDRGLLAAIMQQLGLLGQSHRIAAVEHDMGTGCRQLFGHRPTETARSACDKGHAAH